MLSAKVLTRQDIRRAASYYEDGADDYYAKDGAAKAWQGAGAETLGLAGEIDSPRFKALLAGQVAPEVRVSRGSTRNDAKERIGIDLTFSAPKSVSLQALVAGDARVVEATGADVTDLYVAAARAALALAREHGCRFALLIDGSPSCGSGFIYDGAFAGRKHVGAGVTAALLRQHGIEVFAETEIDALQARLS